MTSLPHGQVLSYRGTDPRIGKDVFIAPTAAVIGDVVLEDETSIWFGAVLRGDEVPIRIGAGSNVQDNCVLHGNPGQFPVAVGRNVTIGHGAVLHGARVEDNCLIGMGSVLLDGAVIGQGAVIAAGAVVAPGKQVGPGELWAGCPARRVREVNEEERRMMGLNASHYRGQAATYRGGAVIPAGKVGSNA